MDLGQLLTLQDGVVRRAQLLDAEVTPSAVRRLLRRRELVVVHPGVYLDHTGPLTLRQRQWAAVLACWPAALTDRSVLEPLAEGPVHVAVAHHRVLRPPVGVVVHRVADLAGRTRWNACPPAVRAEHAALDVAVAQPDVAATYRLLADLLQSRRTTVVRVRAALAARTRVPRRRLLEELLDDLDTGACSVLEREYLRLERRHRLPVARRQRATVGPRRRYQDACYEEFGIVVELDGRPFHDTAAARDRDADRDLDHAVDDRGVTVRLTYGLVFRHGCRTVHQIGILLQRRGWTGAPSRCPSCP